MLQPRNTFIVVSLLEVAERKVGAITVPANSDQYCEAVVKAVGPGNIQATGGRSETFDLHPGDRVLVKHQDVRPHGQGLVKVKTGTEYQSGDDKFTIFEQMHVIAVIERAPISPPLKPAVGSAAPTDSPYAPRVRS